MNTSLRVRGHRNLQARMAAFIRDQEKHIQTVRAQVIDYLVQKLLEHTPVWSGVTAGSYFVSTGGGSSGRGNNHSPTQRGTNRMPLGKRKERFAPAAWSASIANTKSGGYAINLDVHVMNDSDIWGEVDSGRAPEGRSRNPAGTSGPAINLTRARFRFVR